MVGRMGSTMGMETTRTKIAILGAGNMGSALAHILALGGSPVSLWDFDAEVRHEIKHHRRNGRFLPGIILCPEIAVCPTASECVRDAELIVICIPSVFVDSVLRPLIPSLRENAVMLNVSKGFAGFSSEPILVALKKLSGDHACVQLAGPAIANDFSKGQRAYVVMASPSDHASELAASCFTGTVFSCTTTTDLMGAAMGGILKNIYAILLGAVSALEPDLRPNHQAAIITACISEMADLATAVGGERSTLYGLAGLGDLLATGYSEDSHNRRFGRMLVRREEGGLPDRLPEGAAATTTAMTIARSKRMDLPLAGWVEKLINGDSADLSGLLDIIG